MFEVMANTEKNCLYVTLCGRVGKSEAEQIVDKVVECAAKLTAGFGVIDDLRDFKLGDLGAALVLRNVIEFLKVRQVGPVYRIAGKSKVGLIQFMKATSLVRGYEVQYVQSVEEAESLLDRF